MAEEIAFEMAGFPTLKGSWPWPWHLIGSYWIPSCITHRLLPVCHILSKSKKLVDGRTHARTYSRTYKRTAIWCWSHRIWLTTVHWSLLWRTPGSWSFGEHELLLAPEISRSSVLSSGTRYLQICESRHCLRRRLPDTWKLACFVARVSASEDYLFCAI